MRNIIYMYTNLDKNNKLLIIIIGIIVLLLIIIGLYNIISNSIQKAKAKKNRKSLEKEVEEPVIKEEITAKTIVVNPEPVTKEEIKETFEKTVQEEIEEIETLDENVSDIDEILVEMMNIGSQEEFDLTEFEREQEENAIISYGELCKRAGVEKIVYPKKEINKEVEQKIDKEVYGNSFKPSTFISPIYGAEKEEPKEEQDSEFLGRLKEFRSGL